MQWFLGRQQSAVASVINGNVGELSHALDGPESFQENLQRRIAAEMAFLRNDARRSLQRAVVARSRPVLEWLPGTLVYIFKRGPGRGS